MEYAFLLGALENVLGKGVKKSRDNYAFHCPVCNHRKPKLEVNLQTNEKGQNPWECWVCKSEGTSGMTIYSLLKKLRVSSSQAKDVLKYVTKGKEYTYRANREVALPEEFIPLYKASKESYIVKRILNYLENRGINRDSIIKHNIGYCTAGEYADRIIVPSYDKNNQLNYFISRLLQHSNGDPYQNPDTSKDIIFFENLVNWEKPITLCEGVFDALAIRRNVIPILGLNIQEAVIKKILEKKVKQIYIALDKDALKDAIKYCEEFLKMGIKVYLVRLEGKDPSVEGFEKMAHLIKHSKELDFTDIVKFRLYNT